MESSEKATEKTTTKSPRLIVLAHVRDMSYRFPHAFFHGSILTLLMFLFIFLIVVLVFFLDCSWGFVAY